MYVFVVLCLEMCIYFQIKEALRKARISVTVKLEYKTAEKNPKCHSKN